MGPSREKNEKRSVFDVDVSQRNLLYGRNVLNLRPNFRTRRPWFALATLVAAVGLSFWGVRQLYTKAEITDFFPAACLGDWQNTSNAQGKPETLNGATNFDGNDSAVMLGGATSSHSQIFCGGFLPPDYVTQGDIQNVGLTLAWQVGDSPAASSSGLSSDVSNATSDASSTDAASTGTQPIVPLIPPAASTSTTPATSSTSLIPWFIARAFAQDVAPPTADTSTNDASVASPPPQALPGSDNIQTAPPDSGTASDSSINAPAGTSNDSTTIPLGLPLVAPLTPIASSAASSAIEIGNVSSSSPIDSSTAAAAVAPPALDNNFLEISYSTDGQNWIELARVSPDNWQSFTATIPVMSWDDLRKLQVKIEGMPTALEQIPPVYLDGMFVEVHYDIPPPLPLLTDNSTTTPAIAPIAAPKTRIIVLPKNQAPTPGNQNGDFKSDEAPTFDFNLNELPAPASLIGTDGSGGGAPAPVPTPQPLPPPAPPASDTATSTSFLSPAHLLSFFFGITGLGHLMAKAQAVPEVRSLPDQNNTVVAEIVNPLRHVTDLQPTFVYAGNTLRILLPQSGREFRPGAYSLHLWIWRNGAIYYSESDFNWGVLVVNFDKSVYTLGDTASLGFGVLTDTGHTVCDASIDATITSPAGHTYHLSTTNKTITPNASCGPQSITNNPDYSAAFTPKETGIYLVSVVTGSGSDQKGITDTFEVDHKPPYDVSRDAPTRIYPPSTYQVTIHVKANQDFSGPITETAPASFQIISQAFADKSFSGDTQSITWNANLKAGETRDFTYSFLAPDISPELYKLGPLTIGAWQEARQWQIAADAVSVQIRQEINLIDTVVTSTATNVVSLDMSKYDGLSSSTAFYLEVVAKVTSGNATATLRRYGTTTDDASVAFNSTTSTVWRSAVFTPTANASTSYFLNVTGTSPQVSDARIIMIQGGNNITETETQIEIGDNETGNTNLTTSTGWLSSPKYWFYNSSKWDGTITGYAEVMYDTQAVPTSVASSATFTASGNATWTVPSAISPATATIEVWGGGGGGGSSAANPGAGGGGAGGSFAVLNSTSVTVGASYSLVVGAGGAGGTTGGGSGATGASSTFFKGSATAFGGAGGLVDGHGATGTTTGNVGSSFFRGGNGATGTLASFSGGGGGGAGSGGNGGDSVATSTGGAAGAGTDPGGQGAFGVTGATNGVTATSTAAGGSGGHSSSNTDHSGGAGAAGQVKILYHITVNSVSTATVVLQKATSSFVWADDTMIVSAGTSTVATSVRVSFTPTNGFYYRVVGATASSSVPYDIYAARIIIDQVGTPITKIEPQYLLLNTLATPTSSRQQALTTFSPNEWSGGTNTYFHQVDASSTATSSVNLLNATASTTLNSITAATTTVTSTIASMPSVTSTLDISIPKRATTTYADRILVDDAFTVPSPSVSNVVANSGNSTITLTAGATTTISVSYTVTETNGNCSNIFSSPGNITTTLYRAGVGAACSASNFSCYISQLVNTTSDCSGGTVAHATTTADIYYYADSTGVPSSSYPSDNWLAQVQVLDGAWNTTSSATSSNVNVGILTALGLSTSSISYGTLNPSSTTGSTNQPVGLNNAGNSSTTVKVSGNALSSGSNVLATSSQHYATTSFTFGGSERLLSDTATTVDGLSFAPGPQANPGGGAGVTNWSSTQAVPYAINQHSSAVSSSGTLYILGGTPGNGTATSEVIFANINSTGSISNWSTTTALPGFYSQQSSVAYNGYIYVTGGQSTGFNATSTVLFAPINSTGSIGNWSTTKAMLYASELHANVAYSGYLYTLGGLFNGSTLTSTVGFAPINSTGTIGNWSTTTALPTALDKLSAVAYQGYMYVVGGTDSLNGTTTVLFAPINATGSLGSWAKTQSLTSSYAIMLPGLVVKNNFLYSIAGQINTPETATGSVYLAAINSTGSLGSWTSTVSLPSSVYQNTVVAYNNYVYSMGGDAVTNVDTSTVNFAPFVSASVTNTSTYWGATAPAGYPTGTYNSTVTFTAVYSQ